VHSVNLKMIHIFLKVNNSKISQFHFHLKMNLNLMTDRLAIVQAALIKLHNYLRKNRKKN
jgi:hypothetical protein